VISRSVVNVSAMDVVDVPVGTPKRKRRSISGLMLPGGSPEPLMMSGPGNSPRSPPPRTMSTSPMRGSGHKISSQRVGGDSGSNNTSFEGGLPLPPGQSPSSSSDRFIPNRASIDFDFCNSTLVKSISDENAHNFPSSKSTAPQPDSITIKHNNILVQTNRVLSTKRLVDCFDTSNRGVGVGVGVGTSTGGAGSGGIGNSSSNIASSSGNSASSSSSSSGGGGGSSLLPTAGLSSSSDGRQSLELGHSSLTGSIEDSFVGVSSSRDDGFSRLRLGDDYDGDKRDTAGSSPGLTSPGGRSASRAIPSGPSRILDAPELMDDYYLNLLSWGRNNVIAVALHASVYLWHASDGRIVNLPLSLPADQYVTSVQWSKEKDGYLAVGTSGAKVEVWDTAATTRITELDGHTLRVSALAWQGSSNHCLSSGARDSSILNHDLRVSGGATSRFLGHVQEVCGLAWSDCGSTLASGGNENRLCIWDSAIGRTAGTRDGRYQPRLVIEQHNAAVKALAWCPWSRHILASGGGTADRTIRIWNSSSGSQLKCVDTGSQVCAIQWSDTERELVSSHGFSDNQLILWRYPSLTKIKELRGHSARVLHLAKSPDGRTICSASADETIRFWDLFDGRSGSGIGGMGSPRGKYAPKSVLPSFGGDLR